MEGFGLLLNSEFPVERRWAMPRYFFHLTFGQRILTDGEGVELPNRSGARNEALAVIQELSKSEVGGNRRWASWFLQVVDDGGQFLRLPIGRPALEIVTPDSQPLHVREVEAGQCRREVESDTRGDEVAMLRTQLSERRQRAAELLEHGRRLQQTLSALCLDSERFRGSAQLTMEQARAVRAV
jgi:hypothetical protein